ncbi:MAG: homocysteine methyltransferase [Ruminococcaceae bacterium]|nr:homocysteine methyltransferase [Oscillospiraceae bacterium]
MTIREFMKDHAVYLDGGMGSLLQAEGLRPGEHPERWNLTHAEVIRSVHKAYFDAGCNVVNTNTFGANPLKFSTEELEKIVCAAMENARAAAAESCAAQPKFVALDIGPLGRLLKPYGDLDFEDAVSAFAEVVRLGVKYGADLVFIETMNDSYETKAALLAAKENCDLPVFVSNAYGEDGKLMTGASPAAMVALLEGMGADAIGANCSLGPKQLRGVVEELLRFASVPVMLKPNAGLPRSVAGKTVYDVLPEEFAAEVADLMAKGVRIAGGCCGTTPAYIAALTEKTKDITPVPLAKKKHTVVSSYTHAVTFGRDPILIGERINPTGKKRLKEALRAGDMDYILNEGLRQQEAGVQVLDVNVGLPEIDEAEVLTAAVRELQAIINLPLQIDTADAAAMEMALRRYNGKAMINSVNGKAESMAAIFPLVKKYGGVVVALTLDEEGIPTTAAGRIAIAEKILKTAAEYGIDKKNIIFDTLAMTVSAEPEAAKVTLSALEHIEKELDCRTSLGVSNVSFGLPSREAVNAAFFAAALERGLSAAIMNPHSGEMMKTYYAHRALHGLDENCADYIDFMARYVPVSAVSAVQTASVAAVESGSALQEAIIKGLAERAGTITAQLLQTTDGLEIVQQEIIPALDAVGRGFEAKTVYLPQLLMSAEAAKSAFEQIKATMSAAQAPNRCCVVLATVEGDIHDIGKNILRLLLENYGFAVTDLGRDVPPHTIAETAAQLEAPLVGLSALMTTTVPAMAETIALVRKLSPKTKVMVGGAVLTKDYADAIGADAYGKDAMAGVRYAEQVEAAL